MYAQRSVVLLHPMWDAQHSLDLTLVSGIWILRWYFAVLIPSDLSLCARTGSVYKTGSCDSSCCSCISLSEIIPSSSSSTPAVSADGISDGETGNGELSSLCSHFQFRLLRCSLAIGISAAVPTWLSPPSPTVPSSSSSLHDPYLYALYALDAVNPGLVML